MKIRELIPQWMTQGLFNKLNEYDVPWKNDLLPQPLDLAYMGHSGLKESSPLLDMISEGEALTDEKLTKVADMLITLYNDNWTRLYQAIKIEYNPIENYKMTEQGNDTDTRIATGSQTAQATNQVNNKVFGYNSGEAVDSDKQDSTGNTTGSTTANESNTKTHTFTRSGNVGVTTSQQMLESEYLLRSHNFILDVVIKDIDKSLTIKIY